MAITAVPDLLYRQPEPTGASPATRLVYLDNLKIVLIAGVIAAHAATHYIGGGEWVRHGTTATPLITLLGVIGLAGGLFWIGLFFLIAGLLAPSTLDRLGPARFIVNRLLRLGMPFAVYLLIVMPVIHYMVYIATYAGSAGPKLPWTWARTGGWSWDAGPLWFVADLLLFSTVYAASSHLHRGRTKSEGPLRLRHLLALAGAIALGSFLVHIIWPLFTTQFLDLHLSEFPQYTLLFLFGIMSARRGWLQALPNRLWRWCGTANIAGVVAVPILGIVAGALSGNTTLITGGWHWEALATAGIEGVLAVAGSLWVLDYFRRAQDRRWPLGRILTRSTYAAYIVHEPLLILLALTLRPLSLSVEINVLILAPTLIAASFALAWLLAVRLHFAGRIL